MDLVVIQVKAEPKSPKSGGWQDGKKSKDGGIKVKLSCSKDLESMPFQTRWVARGKEEQSKGSCIRVDSRIWHLALQWSQRKVNEGTTGDQFYDPQFI